MEKLDYRTSRTKFPIMLTILYITPLCIYLDSLFFATTSLYDMLYVSLCITMLLVHSRGKINLKHGSITILLLVTLLCLIRFISGAYISGMQTLLLVILIVTTDDEEELMPLFQIIKIIGVTCAIACLVQLFFTEWYNTVISIFFKNRSATEIRRLFAYDRSTCGIMPQTSHAAGIILNALIVFFFEQNNKKKSLKRAIYILILFIALLLTKKRAHFLFGIISIICVQLIGERREKKQTRILYTALILLSAFTLIYLVLPNLNPQGTISRLIFTFQNIRNSDVDVTSDRRFLSQEAIEMIRKSPLWGNGWGSFKSNSAFSTDAHNIYLQLFAECGVFVFIFFVITIISNFVRTIKIKKDLLTLDFEYEDYIHKKFLVDVSLAMQIFFVLYGFTGNGLYNFDFFAIYICCATLNLRWRKS